MCEWRYSSARSAHLLRRPCEKIVPVGIQPIAKRFPMAGCRLKFSWLNFNRMAYIFLKCSCKNDRNSIYYKQK